MKDYSVKIIATVTVSTEVEVRANSKEEAEELAEDREDAINILIDQRASEIQFIEVYGVKEFI